MAPRRRLRPPHLLAATVVAGLALFGGLAACGDGGSSSSSVPLTSAGEQGRKVARNSGCVNCHSTDGGKKSGPTWKDLAGSEVELDDGTTVVADDAYLARSITDPKGEVVSGYAGIMPSFGGLSDDDVANLVAYLRDLSSATATADGTTTTG